MVMILALLLGWAQVSVGGPTQVQDASHPLRVRILERNRSHGSFGARMWGRADIVSPQRQAFDWESECDDVFMVSRGDEVYSARWKKQDQQMEMLVSKIGSGKSDRCVLKVDLKPYVYEYENGAIVTKPMQK